MTPPAAPNIVPNHKHAIKKTSNTFSTQSSSASSNRQPHTSNLSIKLLHKAPSRPFANFNAIKLSFVFYPTLLRRNRSNILPHPLPIFSPHVLFMSAHCFRISPPILSKRETNSPSPFAVPIMISKTKRKEKRYQQRLKHLACTNVPVI